MHKKLVFIFSFMIITITGYGQDVYHTISVKSKTSTTHPVENTHLVKDKKTNHLYAFVEEVKTTFGYQYNSENVEVSSLVSEGLKRKYKEIIGQAVGDEKVRLIQKNNRGKKFASILYDFKNSTTVEEEYDLDMKNQAFLQSYSHEDACYIFTINKITSTIRKHTLGLDGSHSYKDVDLSAEYTKNKIKPINLYSIMLETKGIKSFLSLHKVENRLPNSLEVATQKNKMYEHDNGFMITMDGNRQRTVLLDFQLPELEPALSLIRTPKPLGNVYIYKSNSFILDTVIAQVVSNYKMMNLEIKNIKTLELIKQYSLEKEDSIPFRNSDILQEGSIYSFGATRKMEKTSKFLRKISTDKNGIVLYKTKQGYRATIGGTRVQPSGGGFSPGFGMPIGAIGAMTLSFNPAAFAYGSYNATGSTRIECLFDDDFEHIPGELDENVFDQINAFKEKINKKADNVFYLDGITLFGNYYPRKKEYVLYSF